MLPDHELYVLLIFMVRTSVSAYGSSNHYIAMFRDHDPIITEYIIVRCLDMAPVLLMITCLRLLDISIVLLDIT